MKNIHDNYEIARELIDKKSTSMVELIDYNAELTVKENYDRLDRIVRKIICDDGLTGGRLLYVSSELDRLEWILFKLKRIPVLKHIIRKLEIESYN